MEHKLQVAVHAHWNDTAPVYRIYVDDDLLTERTFGYQSYQFYILEHILCNLDDGTHYLKLVNLSHNSRFELKNFHVDDQPIAANNLSMTPNELLWNFTIDNLLR
jgi:hypothetical protein